MAQWLMTGNWVAWQLGGLEHGQERAQVGRSNDTDRLAAVPLYGPLLLKSFPCGRSTRRCLWASGFGGYVFSFPLIPARQVQPSRVLYARGRSEVP